MVLLSIASEALAALWANRLRSFLTLLGMIMGVTSVITIVSTVEGMQTSIEDALSTLGPNTFIVTRFGVGLSMTEYLERLRRKKLTRSLVPAASLLRLRGDPCPSNLPTRLRGSAVRWTCYLWGAEPVSNHTELVAQVMCPSTHLCGLKSHVSRAEWATLVGPSTSFVLTGSGPSQLVLRNRCASNRTCRLRM